uniref:Transcription factor bHLH67 n=1 Tax=Nothapodytes nimmoniana TaxID=159386 RepID=A0A9E8Z0I1_NOTNI|nr:transcription factor bHLH67 [Nothapodytes nimmoniana]
MIKYAKSGQEEDDEDGDEFFIKKESSPNPKSDLAVKIDKKSTDQKANTPRSKHSATEQRRRSKINDRFQALRRLIPNSDQKRDKASFLLEVIKYIQFLQEKVQKYEGSCQGWNLEAPKLNPCTTSKRNADGFQDQCRGTDSGSSPVLMFPVKFENNTEIPTIPGGGQNPAESDISASTTFKTMDKRSVVSRTGSFPVPLQSSIFHPGGSSSAQLCPRLASDNEIMRSQSSSQLWQSRSCTAECTLASDILKERELTVESGTINVSSLYSKGLLNTLTQALQNSGVDLSQTSISVQIDIGKQANGRLNASPSTIKDDEVPCSNHARFRVASSEEPERALKKLKTGRNSS